MRTWPQVRCSSLSLTKAHAGGSHIGSSPNEFGMHPGSSLFHPYSGAKGQLLKQNHSPNQPHTPTHIHTHPITQLPFRLTWSNSFFCRILSASASAMIFSSLRSSTCWLSMNCLVSWAWCFIFWSSPYKQNKGGGGHWHLTQAPDKKKKKKAFFCCKQTQAPFSYSLSLLYSMPKAIVVGLTSQVA